MLATTLATLDIRKYGITEKKKAEIDQLTNEVIDAQNEVEQLQAIVDSLTSKYTTLQTQLTTDETNQEATLKNKESLEQIVDNVINVLVSSKITFLGISRSDIKIKQVAKSIEQVMNKLIYSTEVINKLSNLVVRKKAQNPLISDDLVTMVNTAGTNANNAVALTLAALNSVIASQTTTIESEGVMSLEFYQAIRLYEFITGQDAQQIINEESVDKCIDILKQQKHKIGVTNQVENEALEKPEVDESLVALMNKAYENATIRYNNTLRASKKALEQLSEAETRLNKATIKLNSLEAGLAAANAAALAS